jgi:hypothetical protein
MAIFVASVTVTGLLFTPFLQLEQLIMTRRIEIPNGHGKSGYHDITTDSNYYYMPANSKSND